MPAAFGGRVFDYTIEAHGFAPSVSSSENASYNGAAGWYLWGIYYSGAGTYHFWTSHP